MTNFAIMMVGQKALRWPSSYIAAFIKYASNGPPFGASFDARLAKFCSPKRDLSFEVQIEHLDVCSLKISLLLPVHRFAKVA